MSDTDNNQCFCPIPAMPAILFSAAIVSSGGCLQFLWLLGDRGIPASWRNMEGFSIHTFVLAAADGRNTYVKFKWEPKAGGSPSTAPGRLNFALSRAHQSVCILADTLLRCV